MCSTSVVGKTDQPVGAMAARRNASTVMENTSKNSDEDVFWVFIALQRSISCHLEEFQATREPKLVQPNTNLSSSSCTPMVIGAIDTYISWSLGISRHFNMVSNIVFIMSSRTPASCSRCVVYN